MWLQFKMILSKKTVKLKTKGLLPKKIILQRLLKREVKRQKILRSRSKISQDTR